MFTTEKENIFQLAKSDIDTSITKLINIFQTSAEAMRLRGQGSYKPANTQPPCWDETCEKLKCEKYTTLRIFKVTNDKKDLQLYKECRGKFENMYLHKINQYQSLQRQKLLESRSTTVLANY